MKRTSTTAAVVASVALVLALTSCAPAVHSTSGTTTHPHASAKPHPKPVQAAVPTVRVPVKCASLETDAAAAAIMGSPVKHHRDSTTPVVDITDITARQYGTLDCLWGGDPQDSGYDQYLSIDVTPDAAAGFTANLSGFSNEDPPATVNTAGDQSVYGCTVTGDLHCSGNMLVGSYWVTAYVQDLGAVPVTQTVADANIQQVLTTVASALKSTKANPAWNPPGPALPTFCSSNASTAKVNTALGLTDFAPVGEDEAETDAGSFAQTTGDYTQCAWGAGSTSEPFTYLTIAMLKGGAWVLPELAGETNSDSYMLGAYTTMTVPGATSAAGACSTDANECEVALSIGSLLVVVSMDDPSAAQSNAVLANIVADIKAS